MTSLLRIFTTLTICSLLLETNLHAQSAWLPPTQGSTVSLELYRIDNTASNFFQLNGTALFLTTRYHQQSGLTIVFELPISHSEKIETNNFFFLNSSSQTTFGNPYFGISLRKNQPSSTTLDAGIRLPLTKGSKGFARSLGSKVDFDRWEAFASKLYSFRLALGRHWNSRENRFSGWIKGGGTILSTSSSKDVEAFANYNAGLSVRKNKYSFGSSFVGQTLLTNTANSMIDNSEFFLGIRANVTLGSVRPGVSAHFPLLDSGLRSLGRNIDAVYGLNITYLFGGNE